MHYLCITEGKIHLLYPPKKAKEENEPAAATSW